MRLADHLLAHRDPVTGVRIVQLTLPGAANHHLFPSPVTCTSDGRFVVFVSYETGTPNLCSLEAGKGELYRQTYRKDLNPFSATMTKDDQAVLFTAGEGLWAVTVPDGTETLMTSFAGSRLPHVAAAPDGRSAAVTVRAGERGRIVEVDLMTCAVHDVLDRDGPVGRLQYSPEGDRIMYSAGASGGLRAVRRDGTGDGPVVPPSPGEWIGSGAWLDGRTVIFVKFHDGLYILPDGGEARALFKGPAWHVSVRSDGKLAVFDTHSPDIGLVLISPVTGKWRTLCYPRSSNRGLRWADPLPHGDETMETSLFGGEKAAVPEETEYGPAWTHPHPSFTPDGVGIFFTSDFSGTSQAYHAEIPPEWAGELTTT